MPLQLCSLLCFPATRCKVYTFALRPHVSTSIKRRGLVITPLRGVAYIFGRRVTSKHEQVLEAVQKILVRCAKKLLQGEKMSQYDEEKSKV